MISDEHRELLLKDEKTHAFFKRYIRNEVTRKEIEQFRNHLREKQFLDHSSMNTPLEYIFGKAMFMGNVFRCTPDTFIPRKDTELLVINALNYAQTLKKDSITVFDIGTGSCNLAITLAMKNKNMTIYASDICEKALSISKENVSYYNLKDRIKLLHGNLFDPHDKSLNGTKADIIMCNPPYIPTSKLQLMPEEIINHEPVYAFDGGPFGFKIFKKLIKHAPRFLHPKGMLLFEFGAGQHGMIKRFFERSNKFQQITFYEFEDEKRAVSAIYQLC